MKASGEEKKMLYGKFQSALVALLNKAAKGNKSAQKRANAFLNSGKPLEYDRLAEYYKGEKGEAKVSQRFTNKISFRWLRP